MRGWVASQGSAARGRVRQGASPLRAMGGGRAGVADDVRVELKALTAMESDSKASDATVCARVSVWARVPACSLVAQSILVRAAPDGTRRVPQLRQLARTCLAHAHVDARQDGVYHSFDGAVSELERPS